MTKQEARRIAYRIAYRFLQQAIDGGGNEATGDQVDQQKIDSELDKIAQRMFERSDLK